MKVNKTIATCAVMSILMNGCIAAGMFYGAHRLFKGGTVLKKFCAVNLGLGATTAAGCSLFASYITVLGTLTGPPEWDEDENTLSYQTKDYFRSSFESGEIAISSLLKFAFIKPLALTAIGTLFLPALPLIRLWGPCVREFLQE